MNTCGVCGGAIFPPGVAYGYVGPVCPHGGIHPTYVMPAQVPTPLFPAPLTADDVRRIVREELERAANQTTASMGEGK